MSSDAIIDARHVSKQYKVGLGRAGRQADATFHALRDVNFMVHRGESVALLGANGAGKSTLLKIISRVTRPTAGDVRVAGRLGSLLEVGAGFHPELTGRENVFLNGAMLGLTQRQVSQRFETIIDFAEVTSFLDTPVKRYSSGMYVRLAFAVASHLQTDILLVDEVLGVGDAAFQAKCLTRVRELCRSGDTTVLLVSHNMAAIQQTASRVLYLNAGELLFDGQARQGISRYNKDLGAGRSQVGAADTIDLQGRYNVHRPGELWLLSAEVAGEQGSNIIAPETPLTLRVRLRAHRALPDAVFGLRISSADGNPVASFTSNRLGMSDGLQSRGDFTLELKIPSVGLVPGDYSLDFGITAFSGGHVIDEVRDIAKFGVRDEIVDPTEWSRLFGDGAMLSRATFELRKADKSR